MVSHRGQFKVAIIPYTHEQTNFHQIKEGSVVNLSLISLANTLAVLWF